jgi:hypothetical protein
MWADFLTKPLQGQKFRDMHAFLKNCPRDYDNDVEFQLSIKPQDVTSSRECVDEHAKLKTNQGDAQNITHDPQYITFSQPQATSPTCVSQVTWGQVTSIPQVSSVPEHKIKHVSNDMKSTGESLQKVGIPQRIPQRIVQKECAKLTKA